jgi:DNA replication protein DnaC
MQPGLTSERSNKKEKVMENQPAKQIGQILGTLELSGDRPTTRQPSQGFSESAKKEKQPSGQQKSKWLDKWLNLKITHPQLLRLEDQVWMFASAYARTPARGRTLVLYGENGSGKTRTARALHRWASSIAKLLPMVDADESIQLARTNYGHWPAIVDGFKKQRFDATEELADCELCCIDDIGAEHDPSGFGSEQLYLLLCRREFKWNILTTNLPPAEWDSRLERRIASRLFRNAEHVDLSEVPDFGTL